MPSRLQASSDNIIDIMKALSISESEENLVNGDVWIHVRKNKLKHGVLGQIGYKKEKDFVNKNILVLKLYPNMIPSAKGMKPNFEDILETLEHNI